MNKVIESYRAGMMGSLVATYTYGHHQQGFASRKMTSFVFNGTTEEYETNYSFKDP